jgi:hypothetical protein
MLTGFGTFKSDWEVRQGSRQLSGTVAPTQWRRIGRTPVPWPANPTAASASTSHFIITHHERLQAALIDYLKWCVCLPLQLQVSPELCTHTHTHTHKLGEVIAYHVSLCSRLL